MRRRRWMVLVLSGAVSFFGCTRTSLDPCRGRAPPAPTFRVSPETGELPILVTLDASGSLARAGNTVEYLRYGFSHPLNVARREIRAAYYGSPVEGFARNESVDLRVTHEQVSARFYREPDHVLVGQAPTEIWNVRPGEERLFMIPTALRGWQLDWIELRPEAFTARP